MRRSRLPRIKMNKLRVLMVLLILSAAALKGVNVYVSNNVTTDSIEASKLKAEIAVYEQQNKNLSAKIYALSSFETVASRAAELGFHEAKEVISLDTPVAVATN